MKKIKVGKLYIGGENKVVVEALSSINTLNNTFKGRVIDPGKGDLKVGFISGGFCGRLFKPLKTFEYNQYLDKVEVVRSVFIKTHPSHPDCILMNKTDVKKMIEFNMSTVKGFSDIFNKQDLKTKDIELFGMKVFKTKDLKPGEFKVFKSFVKIT